METGREDNGDVHVALPALQRAVRDGLEVQRRDALPHVKRPPDGFMSLPGTHLRGHVLYAGGETDILSDLAMTRIFLYLLCEAS